MTFQDALKTLANLHLLDHELLRRADLNTYLVELLLVTLGAKND